MSNPSSEVATARLGHAVIDFDRREICWSKTKRCELSDTENSILRFLVSNRQRAVSRDELLLRLWGFGGDGLETRTIDMHVARLRNKLRDPSGKKTPVAIVTVRSQGYMASPELIPAETATTNGKRA